MLIKFRSFRAISDSETSQRFLDGHVKVLSDYGITHITSNTETWMHNPNMYGIVAELEDNTMVGGIRVQIADGITPLPVQTAVGAMDPRLNDLVDLYAKNGGVGELCALWNAKSVAGVGISVLLTRAGISIVNQLYFDTLMGICAEYTLKMFSNVGFVVVENLGNEGKFMYPDERYIARVLGILNAVTLDTATPHDRKRMVSLRENPIQVTDEKESKNTIKCNYNLILPSYND